MKALDPLARSRHHSRQQQASKALVLLRSRGSLRSSSLASLVPAVLSSPVFPERASPFQSTRDSHGTAPRHTPPQPIPSVAALPQSSLARHRLAALAVLGHARQRAPRYKNESPCYAERRSVPKRPPRRPVDAPQASGSGSKISWFSSPWTSITASAPLRATRESEWSTSLTGPGTG